MHNVYDDRDDPHRTALEDNVDRKMTLSVWLSVFFLGLAFAPAVGFPLLGASALLVKIGLALEGNTDNTSWLVAAWTISASVTYPIGGQLSDIFGRKWVILTGEAFVLVGAIIVAAAQSLAVAIAGQAVGAFGTGLVFVAYPGIMEIVSNRHRAIGLAWTEACIGPMNVFGSLISNALEQNTELQWRWIYIITAILTTICIVGTTIVYYPPSYPQLDEGKNKFQLFMEIDFVGLILYATGVVLLLVGVSYSGTNLHSVECILPIVLGIVMFISAFPWGFSRFPKFPIFPWVLFKEFRGFVSLLIVSFVTFVFFRHMRSLNDVEGWCSLEEMFCPINNLHSFTALRALILGSSLLPLGLERSLARSLFQPLLIRSSTFEHN